MTMEYGDGSSVYDDETTVALQEAMISVLQERIAELEIDDRGWLEINNVQNQYEFSRDHLNHVIRRSRLFFLSNPLVKRAVTLQAFYVWGQGVTVTAKDDGVKKIVETWMQHPKNRAELTSHQSRITKEQDLQVEGNIFFTMFGDRDNRTMYVRTIPVQEITEIIYNPDDKRESWFYRREYMRSKLDPSTGRMVPDGQATVEFYPDWQYRPIRMPPSIGKYPVVNIPVYHVKVGGLSSQQFGIPETYQTLDWVRAYRQFLEDWATIQRALARFAWHYKTQGGAAAVSSLKNAVASKLSTSSHETNPPPASGSSFVSTPNIELQPLRTAGATTGAEEGRRLLLMVCAGTGLPETFFGDVSVGTLATAHSLDRPTELKFRDRQTLWSDILKDLLSYLFDLLGIAPDQRDVTVTFPPILEHDITETVNALVKGATLDGKPLAGTVELKKLSELFLTAIGVANVDEIIDEMTFPDETEVPTPTPTPTPAQPTESEIPSKILVQPAHNGISG